MKVKICGIKSEEVAKQAIEHGADALGFVFATSKRSITPHQAKEIVKALPADVWKVGVFVDEPITSLLHIAKNVELTHIQLHGDESLAYCQEVVAHGFEVIKALEIKAAEDLAMITHYGDYIILVDSPRGKYHGGNGISFDWSLIQRMNNKLPSLILAGGLTVENVKGAIATCAPYMVDVSSGVEVNGEKSPQKIKQFIAATKKEGEHK